MEGVHPVPVDQMGVDPGQQMNPEPPVQPPVQAEPPQPMQTDEMPNTPQIAPPEPEIVPQQMNPEPPVQNPVQQQMDPEVAVENGAIQVPDDGGPVEAMGEPQVIPDGGEGTNEGMVVPVEADHNIKVEKIDDQVRDDGILTDLSSADCHNDTLTFII